MQRLIISLYLPILFNQLVVVNAFQGIKFTHALTIVFISIGICLSYFFYKMYKSSQAKYNPDDEETD